MLNSYKKKEKELDDMIETIKEDEKKKQQDAKNEFSAFREETRNRTNEETNHMKLQLEARFSKHHGELEQLHTKYAGDTSKKIEDHTSLFSQNKTMSKQIERQLRSIANKKAKIDLTRLKILQHSKESALRNQTLKKEKDNIARNYQELKTKMKQFRDEEARRLVELVNNSRNAVHQLTEYHNLGEKILKTAELARRLETEKEKVLPFYENSANIDEIPEEL